MKLSKYLNEIKFTDNLKSAIDPIKMSCGQCGQPLDAKGETMAVPSDYNPDNYPHAVCSTCEQEEYEKQQREYDEIRYQEELRWHEENDK